MLVSVVIVTANSEEAKPRVRVWAAAWLVVLAVDLEVEIVALGPVT